MEKLRIRSEEKPPGPSAASCLDTSSVAFLSVVDNREVGVVVDLRIVVEVIGENASIARGRTDAAAAIASETNLIVCVFYVLCVYLDVLCK